MQAYLARRAAAPLLVLAYLAIAQVGVPRGAAELYPFFDWSLFSSASNPTADVVLLVRSVEGRELDRATLFYELRDDFQAARNRDSRLAKALDRLAWTVHAGDEKREGKMRATIEATFMSDVSSVEYDLAVIRYDPIERLQTGAIQSTTILRSYRKP